MTFTNSLYSVREANTLSCPADITTYRKQIKFKQTCSCSSHRHEEESLTQQSLQQRREGGGEPTQAEKLHLRCPVSLATFL